MEKPYVSAIEDYGNQKTIAMLNTTERLRDILVNGRAIRTSAETLADIVVEQNLDEARVATAVNGEFVAERARAGTALRDGDSVEILSVRQGG